MDATTSLWTRLMRGAKRRVLGGTHTKTFRSSRDYWERRYRAGGNSGAGSYNHLAEFKAEVLDAFVRTHQVADVIEFGCGDGNQLALAQYPRYIGYDVSHEALQLCRKRFERDSTKSFFPIEEYDGRQADLALSLDVIFHLVEDAVFDTYMRRLFDAGRRYVVVYSSNEERPSDPSVPHVRHRKFTDWVARHRPDWELREKIPNRYPDNGDLRITSFADFYVFGRSAADR